MQAQHCHPAARKPRLPRRQAVATRKTNAAYKSPPPPTTAATTRTMATTLDIDDADDTNTWRHGPQPRWPRTLRLTRSWASALCIKITHPVSPSSTFKPRKSPPLPLRHRLAPPPPFASPPLLPRHGARPALTPCHDTRDPLGHPPACKTGKPFPASPAVTPSKHGAQGLPARRNDTDTDLTT
ncbi:hypothetical protein EDB85DRAFT_2027095 [Lactarius pseudohatsudake]|nr:hypothetical protein EDB85DRAFT_2027095 [Lactarius pseudohatsudake]